MPITDRPSIAQQENIISLLAYSEQHGRVIAALVDASLFDGDYRLIADRCIDYWKRFDQVPGVHTFDLFADITEDAANARRANTLRRVLLNMQLLAPRVNSQYVLGDLQTFMKGQLLRDAIIRGAEALAAGTINVEEVEQILAEVLRTRTVNFDRGVRLDDDLDPFLDWLSTRHSEFATGISVLDNAGIVPYRGAIMLFIAGKGRGKTWFLINIGKLALIMHKRVLHISLENDENECRMRYYMALFAASRHRYMRDANGISQSYATVPQLIPPNPEAHRDHPDGKLRIKGITDARSDKPLQLEVPFSFESENLRLELETRLVHRMRTPGNLIIKRFPNRMLTVDGMAAYLDTLEQVEGFIPDLVLLDYAKLLKLPGSNAQDRRVGIGDNFEKLRALAIQRNIALVTADQLNRPGYDRQQAKSTHIGEDWSQVHTADIVLTHSATDAELRHGLCRIYVDHARSDRDKFGVLVTQNFGIGQFCLDSHMLPDKYFETLMPGRTGNGADTATAGHTEEEPDVRE